MTAPNMDGPRRAMLSALRNAGVNVDGWTISMPTARPPLGRHQRNQRGSGGLGRPCLQDRGELHQIQRPLCLVVAGIESVFTVLALHEQKVPPTINLFNQDPNAI